MAATVAPSQSIMSGGGGLHPLQAQGLHASQRQHQQQQQQQQIQQQGQGQGQNQQPNEDGESLDLSHQQHLSLDDFVRVRTLGTGKDLVSVRLWRRAVPQMWLANHVISVAQAHLPALCWFGHRMAQKQSAVKCTP